MNEGLTDYDTLYDDGWRKLDDGDLDGALEIGERLERHRWTGGVELQAAVFEEKGDLDKAISTLERGIQEAGGPYLLYSRLGNCLSDAGQYEEALSAYEKGLSLDPTDKVLFQLNRGIVLSRMGRPSDAVSEFRVIEQQIEAEGDGEARYWHLKGALADDLSLVSDVSELAQLVEPLRDKIESLEAYPYERARLCAAYAVGLFKNHQLSACMRWLNFALEFDPKAGQTMWLVRETQREKLGDGGGWYRLLVEGVWSAEPSEEEPAMGFFMNFYVVAEDEAQALELTKTFLPFGSRQSMRVDEFEVLDQTVTDPKGVYDFDAFHLFPLDDIDG